MNAIVQIDAVGTADAGGTVGPPALVAAPSTSRAQDWQRSMLLAELICDEISEGQPLTEICRGLGIQRDFVYRWRDADPVFAAMFLAARKAGFDAIADEILQIADDPKLDPKARRVMTDVRLRLLAKWASGTYADKLELSGTTRNLNINVDLSADPTEAARQYSDIMRG